MVQVGKGSCQASKEGLGCSQEEICISGGIDHDHPAHHASPHVHASIFQLDSQTGAAITPLSHCTVFALIATCVTVVNAELAGNANAACT